MMTTSRIRTVSLLMALGVTLALVTQARAEATLTYTGDGGTNHIYLCQDAVFFDDAGSSQTMMYDSKRKVMATIDHTEKSYMEISESDFQAMGSQLNDAMAMAQEKMAEAMKDMSPEQQEAMKSAMGSMGGMQNPAAAVEAKYEAKPLGKKQTINSFACEGYTILKNGEPSGEVWVTSLKEAGLSKKDLEPLGALAQFVSKGMKDILGSSSQTEMLGFLDPNGDSFVGLPVRFDGGDGDTSELVSVEKGDVDRKSLLPGANYERKNMMDAMQGSH